jgi:hypothetical protein
MASVTATMQSLLIASASITSGEETVPPAATASASGLAGGGMLGAFAQVWAAIDGALGQEAYVEALLRADSSSMSQKVGFRFLRFFTYIVYFYDFYASNNGFMFIILFIFFVDF